MSRSSPSSRSFDSLNTCRMQNCVLWVSTSDWRTGYDQQDDTLM